MNDMFRLLQGEEAPAKKKELRAHQVLAIQMIRQSLGLGNRRVVCAMPTGAGKTLTAAKIIESARAKRNRVIFTAPAISLIDQTVNAFEAEGITDIGVMQANHPRTDPLAAVQVASVQTLARREIPEAAMVIVDECHIRSEAVEKLMDDRPDVFFIGLSATPWAKGMGLRWQDLVIPVTIGELIEQGYLSKFSAFAPDVPDLSGVKISQGDYAEAGLQEVMGSAKLVGSVVDTWLEQGEDRPTLCFAVNRAHAAQLQQQFERAGVAAGYVDAMTDMVERARINQQFRDGDVKVICSVRTMTTGVDLPVSCIIDAAPTKSEILHVQKVGRGLRVNPGTEDCKILDHAGNSLRLGLVTDIVHRTLDKTPKGEKQERKESEKLPKPCSVCGLLHNGLICPGCGHEKKPQPGFEVKEGDLVEITGRKAPPTMEEKQRFWSMALHLDRTRSRGGKLAKGLYKGKYGVWPRGLLDAPVEPDRAFMNYEKSRRIAYAKKMAGAA
jgi:DNA repair protein RadD